MARVSKKSRGKGKKTTAHKLTKADIKKIKGGRMAPVDEMDEKVAKRGG